KPFRRKVSRLRIRSAKCGSQVTSRATMEPKTLARGLWHDRVFAISVFETMKRVGNGRKFPESLRRSLAIYLMAGRHPFYGAGQEFSRGSDLARGVATKSGRSALICRCIVRFHSYQFYT